MSTSKSRDTYLTSHQNKKISHSTQATEDQKVLEQASKQKTTKPH